MDFQNTFENTNCNCLDGAEADNISVFVRRVGESKTLKARDFRTHHERGKIPHTNSCEDICSYRGLSIEKYTEEWPDAFAKRKETTNAFSPQNNYQMAKFKLGDKSCKVKYTPNQQDGYNKFHYDLYKSDEFDVNLLTHLGFH